MALPPAVGRIERLLGHLHDAEPACPIEPFVVGPAALGRLPAGAGALDEQLWVQQHADGLDLSLYLAPQVLRTLATDDPWRHLHGGNFPSLCLAVEGISHFLLVTWRHQLQRPISALEMELQAEVDKFAVAMWLCHSPGPILRARARMVWGQLFASPCLQPQLGPALVERYWLASRGAGRALWPLVCGDPRRLSRRALPRWTARFARLPLSDKLWRA